MKRSLLLSGVIVFASLAHAHAMAQTAVPTLAVKGSFAWKGEETPFVGGPDALRAQVRGAVDTALNLLGCTPAKGVSADLLVFAHVAQRDVEAPIAGLTTLVVDLVDAPTSTLLWRSFDSDLSAAALAQASFARGKTYEWRDLPDQLGVEHSFTRTDRYVRNAMEAVMLFRDWRVASDATAADVVIAYRVTARAKAGKEPLVATLVVELSRRGATEVAWRSERTMKVPKASKLEDAVIDAVVEIARDYRQSTAQ
jgi:hypothetical protein